MATELVVGGATHATLDVQPRAPVEWGKTEYIPLVNSEAPDYEGTYEVTPTATEQTLGTMNRLLRRDVTVHKVPYFETSNESGGVTVSILS